MWASSECPNAIRSAWVAASEACESAEGRGISNCRRKALLCGSPNELEVSATTTEVKDRQVSLTERSGATGGNVSTSYGYDVGWPSGLCGEVRRMPTHILDASAAGELSLLFSVRWLSMTSKAP
jgi:hypothetical protein